MSDADIPTAVVVGDYAEKVRINARWEF